MTDSPIVCRRGEGRPLLVVHGLGVDHRALLPLDDALGHDGRYERLYVDLPGFGQAPRLAGRASSEHYAAWLDDVVAEEIGEEPFAVLGHSFGGLLSRRLVADRGEQVLGLGLLCPVAETDEGRRALPPRAVLERDDQALAALSDKDRERFEQMAVRQGAEVIERWREHVLPGIEAADADVADELQDHYDLRVDPEQEAAPFEGPSLLVAARQDSVVGFADQARILHHYPRATYAVLDGAGHHAHLERPDIVGALVIDWITRLP